MSKDLHRSVSCEHLQSRRTFVQAAAATGLACAVPITAQADEAKSRTDVVTIFHTNDIHGHLTKEGDNSVGLDYVAGLRAATPHALLIDAGDATQGAPVATVSKGQHVITVMNAAGYDAMCIGNHDLDFGQEQLIQNAEGAEFPILGANVLKDGAPLLQGIQNASGQVLNGASTIIEIDGRTVGIFGLLTTSSLHSISPSSTAGLEFADEATIAEQYIRDLADAGAEAIVALCHMGDCPVECPGPELVRRLSPEAQQLLTAVVDGHSHSVENDLIEGVLVVQTGCNLANMGKLTLEFAQDGSIQAHEELLNPADVAALADPDPATSAVLNDIMEELNQSLMLPAFQNPTTLWAGVVGNSAFCQPTRAVETNLGDMVTDALRACATEYLATSDHPVAMPVVAVENGGGIREAFRRGTLYEGDLMTTFPFSNTVVLKQVYPAALYLMFENAYDTMAGQDAATGMLLQDHASGHFLQFSGCTVTCDPNAPAGERVLSVVLDGLDEPLDPTDEETPIMLVSNSYVMTGAENDALLPFEQFAEVGGELEAVREYMDRASAPADNEGLPELPFLPNTAGRLLLRGGYEPSDWIASVRIVDENDNPLANYAEIIEVDAAEQVEVLTDMHGVATLVVSDGPHALALYHPGLDDSWLSQEVYVDNYMGYGLVEDELRTFPKLVEVAKG